MNRKIIIFVTILVIGWSLSAEAQDGETAADPITLKVGDPAPGLTYIKWYKGSAVDRFEPGHIYVVEFWATWCGPCRMAMPHLSELADTYRDQVTVIGFNVRENRDPGDPSEEYLDKVDQFVTAIGDGMDYSVAADVPGQTTWKDWMIASGQRGIPTSFVVDAQGKIAWIGHPFGGLDFVIDQVINGTSDAEAVNERVAEQSRYLKEIQARFFALVKEEQFQEAFDVGQEVVEKALMGKAIFAVMAYDALKKVNPAEADQYLQGLLGLFANDPMNLQALAQNLIDREDPAERQLATTAIDRALDKSSAYDNFAYRLAASIHFKSGNVERAVRLQEQTIEIIRNAESGERSGTLIKEANEVLENYKAAL